MRKVSIWSKVRGKRVRILHFLHFLHYQIFEKSVNLAKSGSLCAFYTCHTLGWGRKVRTGRTFNFLPISIKFCARGLKMFPLAFSSGGCRATAWSGGGRIFMRGVISIDHPLGSAMSAVYLSPPSDVRVSVPSGTRSARPS